MPTISVFIRKGDLDKFKALPNKSEFLHNALKTQDFSDLDDIVDDSTIRVSVPEDNRFLTNFSGLKVKACKHGYDPKFCKFAKPGKVCK